MKIPVSFFLLLLAMQAGAQVFVQPGLSKDSLFQRLSMNVTSMMEISRMSELQVYYSPGTYPESGLQSSTGGPGNTDSFRVRANHSFLVSVAVPGKADARGVWLERKEYDGRRDRPAICVASRLSDMAQSLRFNCLCSTDQWFLVKDDKVADRPAGLVYTCTAP
jgi:hypothetical protein